jgi:hypothetical protein
MDTLHPSDSRVNMGLCCCICLEQYRDPRTLACAHTFCQSCIDQHILKQKDEDHLKKGIECPLCRKVTPKLENEVPVEEWSKSLPVNYALQDAIEAQIVDNDLCTVCILKAKHTPATKYCIQCKRRLCSDCEITHNIFEHLKIHKIVRIDDTEKIKTFPADLDQCTTHGKPIEFYCEDEHKLCCSSCAIIKHRKCHEVVEISDIAAKNNVEKEKSLLSRIKELQLQSVNIDFFFDQKEKELDRKLKEIDDNMVIEQDKIINMLKESRARVLKEAMVLRDRATEQYTSYKMQCQDIKKSMVLSFKRIDIARKFGTSAQLFIALHEEETKLTEETAKCDDFFKQLEYLDVTSENANTSSCFEEVKQCELRSQDIKIDANQIPDHRIIKMEKVKSVDLKSSLENESEPLYTGLDFLPNGGLIAVDNANKKIVVMNEDLEITKTYIHDTVLLDVLCISMENVFVTNGPELLTFDVNDDDICSRMNTIEIPQVVDSLSEYNNDMFVVGTYASNKPAALMYKNGEIKDFDVNFPDKEWKLGDSFNAFDKETGVLAITDAEENKIYIYDTIQKSQIVFQDERIKTPRGIAPGLESTFFICSHGTGKIVQISQDGAVLHTYEIDMHDPYTLCFSKDKKFLAVANYTVGDSKLHIYRVSHSNHHQQQQNNITEFQKY